MPLNSYFAMSSCVEIFFFFGKIYFFFASYFFHKTFFSQNVKNKSESNQINENFNNILNDQVSNFIVNEEN